MDTHIVSGKAYWASVTAPNTTYEPVWCVDVCLDDDSKSLMDSLGLNVQNKGDDRGDFIKIKRKVYKRDGTQRNAPVIKDSQNNSWDGSLIGSMSVSPPWSRRAPKSSMEMVSPWLIFLRALPASAGLVFGFLERMNALSRPISLVVCLRCSTNAEMILAVSLSALLIVFTCSETSL